MFRKQSPTENPKASRQMERWGWDSAERPELEARGWGRRSSGRQGPWPPTSQMSVESVLCDSTSVLWVEKWPGWIPPMHNQHRLGWTMSSTGHLEAEKRGIWCYEHWVSLSLCSLLQAGKGWDILSTHGDKEKQEIMREGRWETNRQDNQHLRTSLFGISALTRFSSLLLKVWCPNQ